MHAEGWVPEDSFALRLVIVRRQSGDLSQVEAAERCGLKPSTWATWENGARPRGMDKVVESIHRGLGTNKVWLMWGGPLTGDGLPPDGAQAMRATQR